MPKEFNRLMKLLGEMQHELSARAWTESHWDRSTRATDFRLDLWDAICAYRDLHSAVKVPS